MVTPTGDPTAQGLLSAPARRDDDAARARRQAILDAPGFGLHYADTMVCAERSAGQGWGPLEERGFGELGLSPATFALHYGQSVFEGMKAYAQPDGSVALFRVDAHAARFRRSAERLSLPPLPAETFVEACERAVRGNRDWVPRNRDHSLYLRPLMFGSEAQIGVRPAEECLFAVFASPVAPFFSAELRPVRLWVCDDHSRAGPGGTGDVKCAGNYAASLLPKQIAVRQGCDDVLFLDAVERRCVEELSGMNVFFVDRSGPAPQLLTPELNGCILPGITRDSVIALARRDGMDVRETRLDIEEVWRRVESGDLTEAFAVGTAAIVAPIGELRARWGTAQVGDGGVGEVASGLRRALLDIQEGRAADDLGWRHIV